MNKDYYLEYFHLEREHWWFKARLQIIDSHLNNIKTQLQNKELKILNVGAGPGATTELLIKYGQVTSVEYDKDCLEIVKQKLGLLFDNESITNLPYEDNYFDLVVAFDVIEHIEDHEKGISELIRVCKKNGFLFTTVPAFQFMWSQHDLINHHFRRYTSSSYKKLWIKNNQVQLFYSTYFNFFLFPPIALFRLISKVIKWGKKKNGAGSDFTTYKTGWFDKILFIIFKFEKIFIRNKVKLPFGVSYMMSCKKI